MPCFKKLTRLLGGLDKYLLSNFSFKASFSFCPAKVSEYSEGKCKFP
jgi:hypothetical protein